MVLSCFWTQVNLVCSNGLFKNSCQSWKCWLWSSDLNTAQALILSPSTLALGIPGVGSHLPTMFKGFEKVKDVQYVYTPFDSSLCGVKLEANNKKQYLLTGQILNDGKVFIHLCNYIEPWDDLSLSQKKSLNQRYQMGCGCKITTCYMVPCSITAPNECLWTDWLIERKLYGHQAKHYACIKRSDGTCSWYRGGPPPEKDFIDISEP
uniref:Metalloproteinase inhibitor 4 n=1 Tax=Amazona collaria TaxID=241587 RepID=A0A8B9GCD3_9PSIT